MCSWCYAVSAVEPVIYNFFRVLSVIVDACKLIKMPVDVSDVYHVNAKHKKVLLQTSTSL